MTQATFSPSPSPLVHKELLATAMRYDSAIVIHHSDNLIRDPALLATLSRVLRKLELARPNLDMRKHDSPLLYMSASTSPKASGAL